MTSTAPVSRARAAWVAGAVVLVALAVGIAVAHGLGTVDASAAPTADRAWPPSSAPGSDAAATESTGSFSLGSVVATFTGDTLDVFEAPDGAVLTTLSRWSAYGSPRTLLAVDAADRDGTTWYQVLVPVQPNGTTGWIRASEVEVASSEVRIDVYLDEHELVVSQGGEETFRTGIVSGDIDASPTPLGVYSITDPLDFTANPTGVYGAYALGLSGFSETLDSFDGGPPQIAIHGTNEPSLIGQSVSNGCIRVTNEAILQIADLAGLGTPVVVHASGADA